MAQRLLTVLCAAIALGVSSCAYPAAPEAEVVQHASSAAPEVLVASAQPTLVSHRDGALSIVDETGDAVRRRVRHGVVSPAGDRVYAQTPRWVRVIDTATGRRIDRVARPGGMTLEVASAAGHLLAFARPEKPGSNEWLPAGRARTTISVVSTKPAQRVRTYVLEGNFAIEAFSTDQEELFLIEYMPSRAPWHYGLRRLNLKDGRVREIEREKQGAPEEMNGTGRLAMFSPTGHELYTLYTQQGFNYTHVEPAEADPKEVYAFVHLLNLNGGWTHCIDLPAPFGTGAATSHAMAVSEDGTRLYVVDPSSGGIALIDPITSLVVDSATADLRSLRRGVSAAVGADGDLYLAGPTKVMVFDGESLRLVRSLRIRQQHPGIEVGTSGTELYVARGRQVVVLDAFTGDRIGELRRAESRL